MSRHRIDLHQWGPRGDGLHVTAGNSRQLLLIGLATTVAFAVAQETGALWRLNTLLQDRFFVWREGGAGLQGALVEVDALRTPEKALRGELLPGWYEDWVLLERERLRQLRMHALEVLADKLVCVGRFGEAVQAAMAAVAAEPLRESARRAVVRVHLAHGNVAEAVREYEAFRELLADELGVAPSPQLECLMRGLRLPQRRRA